MLTNYQKKLVEDNIKLVYKEASKLSASQNKDLIQQGILGLCEAAYKFDVTQGRNFSTFAYYYIHGYCSEYIAKDSVLKPKRVGTVLQKVTPISFNDISYEIQDDKQDIEINDVLLYLAKNTTKLEFNVFLLLYIGYKKCEILKILDISSSFYVKTMNKAKNLENIKDFI